MASTYEVKSFGAFARLFARHQRSRARRILSALRRTARSALPLVRKNIPVAFGELRASLGAENTPAGARIEADAPHAAAVEVGSRPHTPPLAPLIAWVKLRGAQGLLTERQLDRLPGKTTAMHARGVAASLRKMERSGAVSVDAPERIARAIQQKIAREGTMPHWYARQALPDIVRTLDAFVKAAVPENGA